MGVSRFLEVPEVREFIGTEDYLAHKKKRFRGADNPVLSENEAFLLSDPDIRKLYADAYEQSRSLYYKSQPPFDAIMEALAGAVKIGGI